MRSIILSALAAGCLLTTACRIPLSEHPLSDDGTSKVDERLIGTWEIDISRVHEILGNDGQEDKARYRIQRDEENENRLESVYLRDGKADERSLPLYTIHLGMHDYLSMASDGPGDRVFYVICRYEVVGEEDGKLFLMDDAFVIEQIEAGKVAGKVDRDDDEVKGVMLQMESKDVREFVLRHGEKVFDLEHPLACKRVEGLVAKE